MYSYGNTRFNGKKSKFSARNVENLRCNIRSLFLLRKDANFRDWY